MTNRPLLLRAPTLCYRVVVGWLCILGMVAVAVVGTLRRWGA